MALTSDIGIGYRACGLYGWFEVVEYINNRKVKVRFDDTGYEAWTNNSQISLCTVKDRFYKGVCGVGFLGEAKRSVNVDRKAYLVWRSMIYRCYSECSLKTHPSYSGCSVDDRWHDFSNFLQWFNDNYIDGYELDKDIKVKGNKVYSPETCMFVSKKDNLSEKSKKVSLMHIVTGEIVHFKSIKDASNFTGINYATISRACNPEFKSGVSGSWMCVDKIDRYI